MTAGAVIDPELETAVALPPIGLAATPRRTATIKLSAFVHVPDVVDPVPNAYATRLLEYVVTVLPIASHVGTLPLADGAAGYVEFADACANTTIRSPDTWAGIVIDEPATDAVPTMEIAMSGC